MGPLPSPTPTQIGVAGLDSYASALRPPPSMSGHCRAHIPATITGNNCRRIRTPPRLRLLELPVKLRRHPLGLDRPSSPCCDSHALTHLGIGSFQSILSASSSVVFFTGVGKSGFIPYKLSQTLASLGLSRSCSPLPVDALTATSAFFSPVTSSSSSRLTNPELFNSISFFLASFNKLSAASLPPSSSTTSLLLPAPYRDFAKPLNIVDLCPM